MVKVAIMGHGTVGSGVYEVFEMNAEKIARTVGEPVTFFIDKKYRNILKNE